MLSSKPLVSAIIPVFNGEKFLAETIQSVLDQTYPNIECIVVNDGSTDRTADIVKSFGKRVRYIERPNGGVSSARNVGIEHALGEYVAFLDADDLWKPEKTVKQLEVFDRDSTLGLVYSGVDFVNEKKESIGGIKQKFGDDTLKRTLLLETPAFLTMTGMVPKKALDQVGVFDERLSTSADADLVCRIALKYNVAGIDESLAFYRQHESQMHLNLAALENDAKLLFRKTFEAKEASDELRRLRPAAFASLETTLAIGYFRQHRYGRVVLHLMKAVWHSPYTLIRKVFAA
jgi:glycosyltransferase involved in cell wall biosynthesis